MAKRYTDKQKAANNYQYYKNKTNKFAVDFNHAFYSGTSDLAPEYMRNKVNFDLFNNILHPEELAYVCKPYGDNTKALPARMSNKDISSGKIKAFLGMEAKKPFIYNYVAINPEATTRKEQAETEMIKNYVYSFIMGPIQHQIAFEMQEKIQGRELSEEEKQQVQQEVEMELEKRTPKEIKRYMEREYQDPIEILYHHIANYVTQHLALKDKFDIGLKYSALSAKEVYFIGILNMNPICWNVNSQNFQVSLSERSPYIEDGDSCSCDYYMTFTDILQFFGDKLTSSDIKKIEEFFQDAPLEQDTFFANPGDSSAKSGIIKVTHYQWKDMRDIKILHYFDEAGDLQKKYVESTYQLKPELGDVSIEKIWVVDTYECWRLLNDVYVGMGPVDNQIKDIDNPNIAKLSYYGAVTDNMNSVPTSLMDRLVPLQYYFNIIMYRIEMLMASDRGKKIAANIVNAPDNAAMSMEQFMYLFDSSPFMWLDFSQEGSEYHDVTQAVKEIDMSLTSSIQHYVELAIFIKKFAGETIGITENIEGQIQPDEAVNNVKQSMVQNLNILDPYYRLHANVKRNVLEACVVTAIVCWRVTKPEKLSYILDDVTKVYFDLDWDLLNNSTVGLFLSDTTKTEEIKDTIRQLTHAAMQNNKAELSDVLAVLRDESLVSIEETLKIAEIEKRKEAENLQTLQAEQEKEKLKLADELAEKEHQRTLKEIITKEEERRKTELQKTALLGASFNPDLDSNKNERNDFLELAGLELEQHKVKEELRIKEKDVDGKNREREAKIKAIKDNKTE